MRATTGSRRPPIGALLFGGGTLRRAVQTAVVVGSVLVAVNHGDTIAAGQAPPWWKLLLTYCVPFCVTVWGALTVKLSAGEARRDGDAGPS